MKSQFTVLSKGSMGVLCWALALHVGCSAVPPPRRSEVPPVHVGLAADGVIYAEVVGEAKCRMFSGVEQSFCVTGVDVITTISGVVPQGRLEITGYSYKKELANLTRDEFLTSGRYILFVADLRDRSTRLATDGPISRVAIAGAPNVVRGATTEETIIRTLLDGGPNLIDEEFERNVRTAIDRGADLVGYPYLLKLLDEASLAAGDLNRKWAICRAISEARLGHDRCLEPLISEMQALPGSDHLNDAKRIQAAIREWRSREIDLMKADLQKWFEGKKNARSEQAARTIYRELTGRVWGAKEIN